MDQDDDARFKSVSNRVLSILKIVAFCVFIVVAPAAIWVIGRLTPSPIGLQQPTHSELVSTLFTGAALMLGALAVIIAALAIWGYAAIKKESAEIASGSAKRAIERYMKRPATQREIREIIEKLAAPILQDMQAAAQMPAAYADGKPDQNPSKTVGKSYPEKEGA